MGQRWINPHTWRWSVFFPLDWFLHGLIAMRIVTIVPNTHQFIKSKNDVIKLAGGIVYRVDTIVKLSYLFTSAIAGIPVCTTPKSGTEPIGYFTLHVWDRRGAASLCYRNRTAATVLMCEQNPIRYGFRAGAKAVRYCLNIVLVDSGKGHVRAIFLWPWKMVSVSVRHLFHKSMDEKIKTWTLCFPAKENPNMEEALFDWPVVLQYDVKAKYRLISRKFSGMKFFHLSVRFTNQKPRSFVSVR